MMASSLLVLLLIGIIPISESAPQSASLPRDNCEFIAALTGTTCPPQPVTPSTVKPIDDCGFLEALTGTPCPPKQTVPIIVPISPEYTCMKFNECDDPAPGYECGDPVPEDPSSPKPGEFLGLIDRTSRRQTNGQCQGLEICCKIKIVTRPGCTCMRFDECGDSAEEPTFLGPIDERHRRRREASGNQIIDISNTHGQCRGLQLCCKIRRETRPSPIVTTTTPSPVPSNKCGIRNKNGIRFTIRGFQEGQTQFGEFPWMVAVTKKEDYLYLGGGSLVHPKVVLTAAHLVQNENAENLLARLGDWDLEDSTEYIPHQNIEVKNIVFHPQYDPLLLENNVALLIFKTKAVYGPTVRPICLPHPGQDFDGSNCFVTGWGKDVFGKTGRFQKVMKKVPVPAISHVQCQNMLRNTRLGYDFNLHDSFNCAGGLGEDSCDGDGGSPLVCPNPDNPEEYVQIGVVAWGIDCGVVGNPGVYGSIPKTVNWISKTIQKENGFDIRSG